MGAKNLRSLKFLVPRWERRDDRGRQPRSPARWRHDKFEEETQVESKKWNGRWEGVAIPDGYKLHCITSLIGRVQGAIVSDHASPNVPMQP